MRKITGLLAIMLFVSAQALSDDAGQQARNRSGTGGTVTARTDTDGVVRINGDEEGTKLNTDGPMTVEDVNVANFRFIIKQPPPPPVVIPPPPPPVVQPPPPAPVTVGNILVTSDYAGVVMINGEAVGPRLRAGGTMNIVNARTGSTEVALKGDDGNIIQTPQRVTVQHGQTVSVAFKAPPPPPPPVAPPPPPPPPPAPAAPIVRTPIIPPVPDSFVQVKSGTFMMGSIFSEMGRFNDEDPQHQVTISGFYMSKYQVTQGDYQALMGTNPSEFKGYNLPVERVSWYDAVEYCNKLSLKEALTPAYTIDGTNVTWDRNANGYRLPTEAEWEYACRAGTTAPYSTGNKITSKQANFNGNYPYGNYASPDYRENTTPVGNFAPNPWGIFDMHGNVLEWCWDWYAGYSGLPRTDPAGPLSGTARMNRGGSWYNYGRNVRSANRENSPPSTKNNLIGFRLARNDQSAMNSY